MSLDYESPSGEQIAPPAAPVTGCSTHATGPATKAAPLTGCSTQAAGPTTKAAPVNTTGVLPSPVPTELQGVVIGPTVVRCQHCVQTVRTRVTHRFGWCNWIAVFLLCGLFQISNCSFL